MGRVKWSVYSTFVTSAYRGALVPVILLYQILFLVLQMGSNYWISWATEQKGRASKGQLMGTFVLLSHGSSIFILGRTILMAIVAVETAQHLFHGMITSMFRAPISFLDTTPSSRIMSRSSTDQSTVDTDIPYRLAGLIFALIQLLSIILLMSQVAWQVILLFLVVLAIFIWYQAYYITTARELARMVGIRKAPILHHFSQIIISMHVDILVQSTAIQNIFIKVLIHLLAKQDIFSSSSRLNPRTLGYITPSPIDFDYFPRNQWNLTKHTT